MSENKMPTRVFANIKKDVKQMPKVNTLEETRDKFATLIKAYAIQNPVKYEMKKEVLAKHLKGLDDLVAGKTVSEPEPKPTEPIEPKVEPKKEKSERKKRK